MKAWQYIRTLAEFVNGDIELQDFKQLVEDRLFELCQNPEMTDEKRLLSGIELYLHEAEEGLREESEVYGQVQFILDNIILKKLTSKPPYFSPTPSELPYLLSKTFTRDPESPEPKTEDLTLVALK